MFRHPVLAEQLIETLSEDFKPEQYHDIFQDQLRALVEAKQKGKTIHEKSAPPRAKVIDMMDALKKSLQEAASREAPPHFGRTSPRGAFNSSYGQLVRGLLRHLRRLLLHILAEITIA
jgi:iron-sulfur cluster repair protein YtfE (RIC family)